jgi:lysophospholipase L1-like esterase
VRRQVSRAGTVLIMTGANDYVPAFAAGASAARYRAIARTVRHNVTTAVEAVHTLNPHAQVIVLDYWAAMEDGRVAERDYTTAERRRARLATSSLDTALRAAAHDGNARFLSTYLAFNRAAADVTRPLAADGDHPDAAGTRIITDALDALLPL